MLSNRHPVGEETFDIRLECPGMMVLATGEDEVNWLKQVIKHAKETKANGKEV